MVFTEDAIEKMGLDFLFEPYGSSLCPKSRENFSIQLLLSVSIQFGGGLVKRVGMSFHRNGEHMEKD